jgi:hypothetical protein
METVSVESSGHADIQSVNHKTARKRKQLSPEICPAYSNMQTAPIAAHPHYGRATLGGFMLITTTHAVEGRRIVAYHGIVSGEAIFGAKPRLF